ncbi:hypothetical protein [Microbacterium sp. SLBN-111]|uniref:hypothetical protein n=1 Tax=Microbacterium sp. SLBN-111 TaxID=3377733 RepID=UPI003C776A2A
MSDKDEDDAADAGLPAWSRWLIGAAGLAIMTFGTIAVFIKDTNVAGVPLLVVAGAGFLYVSLTGQRLIQVNKDGVVFSRAQRLRRTLDQLSTDPEIPAETKERILDVAEANGVHLPPVTDQQFEQTISEALRSISQEFNLQLNEPSHAGDSGYDFLLTNGDGKQAAIEVKGHLRTRGFAGAIRQLRMLQIPIRFLIIDGSFAPEISTPFAAEGIWIVGWDEVGRATLTECLRSAGII